MEPKGLGRSIPSGAADCAQNDGSEAERTACSGRMGLRKKVKAGDMDLRGTDGDGKGTGHTARGHGGRNSFHGELSALGCERLSTLKHHNAHQVDNITAHAFS